jgi:hypothetical protein
MHILALCVVTVGLPAHEKTYPVPYAVPPATLTRLAPLGDDWKRRIGRFRTHSPLVKRENIPDWIVENAEQWARKLVKPTMLPKKFDWYGVRMAPDVDLVATSFPLGKSQATWIDSATQMILIVKSPRYSVLDTSEDVLDLIRGTFRTSLALPSDWERTLKGGAEMVKEGDPSLWRGQLNVGVTFRPNGTVSSPAQWYDYCPFWTDGQTLYIEFRGMADGRGKWNPDLAPLGTSRFTLAKNSTFLP